MTHERAEIGFGAAWIKQQITHKKRIHPTHWIEERHMPSLRWCSCAHKGQRREEHDESAGKEIVCLC